MKKRLIAILISVLVFVSLLAVNASADTNIGATTTTALKMRKSAGTSASIIMTMPKGAQVIVLSTSNGWCKIVYDNTIGYASKTYLKSTSSVTGSFGTGTLTGTDVRMRSGPSTKYKILGTYDKGIKMSVIGAKGSWYKVKYNGTTGYVTSEYMSISVPSSTSTSTSTTTYTGKVTGDAVRVRSGAGTNYSVLDSYDKGKKVSVLGSVSGWYEIKFDSKTAYISADYLRIVPKTSYSASKDGIITSAVKHRMGPSTSFAVLSTLAKDTEVVITGEYGNWYELTANGVYGYVSKSYIKIVTAPTIPAPEEELDETGTVTGDAVNMRSGPATSYSIIKQLNKGTSVKVTGKTDNWYAITVGGVSGYMSADYIRLGSNDTTAEQIVATAKQYIGTPYVYGGASPSGFDCSGFVCYVYKQYGYELPHGATSQYNKLTKSVSKSNLQPADLVFFSDGGGGIGHVGIYIGNGQFIHSPSSGGSVMISKLSETYWTNHYYGAKRVL